LRSLFEKETRLQMPWFYSVQFNGGKQPLVFSAGNQDR
jgi:hypothetical protein